MITAHDFIVRALSSTQDHTIPGKKRLQKLGMLLQHAGLEIDIDFFLHHYGPYSSELADAADELYFMGVIDSRSEQLGAFGTFQTVYSLPEDHSDFDGLPSPYDKKLSYLNNFSPIELEMASTIAYFERQGHARSGAIDLASSLKPKKSVPRIIKKSEQILNSLQ